MFKCEVGKHISKSLEKQIKVTVAKRTRVYNISEEETTTGFEIVKEINACTLHAINYKEDV